MLNKVETFEHAQFGLRNTQETIRFVDTKVGIVFSVLIFVLGSIVGCLKLDMLSSFLRTLLKVKWDPNWIGLVMFCYILFAVSFLILVFLILYGAKNALIPRTPRDGKNTVQYSVLFPFVVHNGCQNMGQLDESRVAYQKIRRGMTSEEIAREFEDQCAILGYIQAEKIKHCRLAIESLYRCFLLLMALLVFHMLIVFAMT